MKQQLLDTLDYIISSQTSIRLHADKIFEIRNSLEEHLDDEERLLLSTKIKSKVQEEANLAIDNSHGFGSVIMATGTGKSKVAIDRCTKIVSLNSKANILIVVPTEKLRDENWKEEFVKWNKEEIWNNNINPVCYASLGDMKNYEFDLVILDEGHNITEANSKFFTNNTNEIRECILLTATKPKDIVKINILSTLNLNTVYEITLDEAVKLGLVAPYDITIINMNLDSINKNILSGSKAKPFYQTEKAKYKYLSDVYATSPTKNNSLSRMRFIYNLKSKTDTAKLILQHIIPKELRTIVFCGSIEQSIEVCDRRFFSKPSIKKTDKPEKIQRVNNILKVYEGDAAYTDFKESKINRMSCVNSLNEGVNIPELDCAFIVQLNSNELNLWQRIGRTIRFRPGHIGKIIILCCSDSVDKNWVEKATANLNSINIKTIDLSRLRMGIETINFD